MDDFILGFECSTNECFSFFREETLFCRIEVCEVEMKNQFFIVSFFCIFTELYNQLG
jgi:hypothetical protein